MTASGATRLAVSFDASAVPAQAVGAGRYILDLAGALLARHDVTLTLWSRRHDAERWRRLAPAQGARVRPAAPDRRPARLAWEQLRLPALLERSSAAVHHGPHYTMPERARLPRVVTVHDLTFLEHPEWHERAKVLVLGRAIRVAARHADAVVCVSGHTAERFETLCRPTGRVFVVPHGVDHARFRPVGPTSPGASDDEVLRTVGVRPPYILFVGTLEPRKAVPDLVAAFDLIAPGHPDLTLVLAGQPGWGAEAVARAVATARASSRVVRTGYVSDDAVPALLRGAAAVAYPALEEGFGLPALEALACGAPLVTTAGTTMAEMAQGAAVLVPAGSVASLADALVEVVAGGPAVEDRRALGFGIASRHTWEASAERHVAAYRWAARRAADGATGASSSVSTGWAPGSSPGATGRAR